MWRLPWKWARCIRNTSACRSEPDGDSGARAVWAGPSLAAGNRGTHPPHHQCGDYRGSGPAASGIPRPGGVGRADFRLRRVVRDGPRQPAALARAGLNRSIDRSGGPSYTALPYNNGMAVNDGEQFDLAVLRIAG